MADTQFLNSSQQSSNKTAVDIAEKLVKVEGATEQMLARANDLARLIVHDLHDVMVGLFEFAFGPLDPDSSVGDFYFDAGGDGNGLFADT